MRQRTCLGRRIYLVKSARAVRSTAKAVKMCQRNIYPTPPNDPLLL